MGKCQLMQVECIGFGETLGFEMKWVALEELKSCSEALDKFAVTHLTCISEPKNHQHNIILSLLVFH